jgi:acylphosphatase
MANRIHLRIRGKVQGVGFRWYVRERARRCDLSGWVMNNPDGTVELCVEGHEECIARFRAAVATGPDGARVEAVEELEDRDPAARLPYPFQMVR